MTAFPPLWQPVVDELAEWSALGLQAHLWLRDDDAVAPTSALDRLSALSAAHGVPVLVAVIPARAESSLGDYFAGRPLLEPAVHGYAHANHAVSGEKTEEFPLARGAGVIVAELTRGRDRLCEIFGDRFTGIYVPPWNRISPAAAALLARAGFTALSAFGARALPAAAALPEINTHVDIIDWRGNRGGRDHAWLVRELARELAAARGAGRTFVGVLTHHLVHDAVAWSFLESLLEVTAHHPAVRWSRATALIKHSAPMAGEEI